MVGPTLVPTLDSIAAQPDRVLSRDVALALLIKAKTVAAVVERWALEGPTPDAHAPDRALRLDEAAPRLGITTKTLAQWIKDKPAWGACVLHRSRSRILLSAARFEATLRDHVAGSTTSTPVSGRRGARAPMAARFPLPGMGHVRDGGS